MTAQTWVFLRGLIRHQKHWGDFPEVFQKVFPEDRIIMMDLAGNGSESERTSFLDVRAYVADLRARLTRDKVWSKGQPLSLLGVSLGGMVALEWQTAFPEEVARTVVINASSALSPFWRRLSLPILLTIPKLIFFRPSAREIECAILKLTTTQFEPSEKFLAAALSFPGTSRLNLFRQLWAARRFFPQKSISPKLFLRALDDRLCHPSCSEELAKFFSAPLETALVGGHDIAVTRPAWVAATIHDSKIMRPLIKSD